MPSYLTPTGEQAVGDDITGTSDAIVMASAPDVALPLETEPSDGSLPGAAAGAAADAQFRRPWPAIAASAAIGLLLGIVLKKIT